MISKTLLMPGLAVEGALLAGALVLLFGHAFWRWWYRRWSQPLLAQALATLTTDLAELTQPRSDLHRLRTLPVRLQINLLVDVSRSLSGAQRQRLTALAREMGLIARAEVYCRSRLWWRRLHGVHLLTLLGGGETAVPALLRDRHPIVQAQAAEWAADHPSATAIDALLALLADPARLCRFSAQDSLLRMRSAVVEPLTWYLSAHSGLQVEAALEVAVGLAEPRFLAPALRLCRDASPQVRALAATLLGVLGGGEGVEVLRELLVDPAPHVRAAAARALGKLRHWPAVPTLATLLRDPAWAVRREAGLALRALGAPGTLFLRRSLADNDRFAADMARQVLDLPDTAGPVVSP